MLRALVALVLLLPLASAHAVPADLYVAPFPGRLAADASHAEILFDHRCSGMSTNASEPGMTVAFSVLSAPSWAEFRIEPERVDLAPCEGVGRTSARLVGMMRPGGAHAIGPDAIVIGATWSTSGMLLNASAQIEVEPAFVPAFDIALARAESVDRPQTPVVFPVTLTSRAAAPLRIVFEVVGHTGGLAAPAPLPVTLSGPNALEATVPLVVQTPYHNGRVNEVDEVTYRLTAHHALDPRERGEPQEFTVRVHTKGFYVPGPQLFAAMLAIAGAAWLLRRRA